MRAKLLVDVVDRYKEPRKTEMPMTDTERKAHRRVHPKAKEEELVKVKLEPYYYGKAKDEVTIITKDPGEWQVTVIAENKKGERFSVLWNDLTPIKDEKPRD